MDTLLRRIDGLIEILAGVGVLAYCAAALVSVADVLGRRVGLPVVGVVDLVQMFVIAGAWLSIPWGFTAGAHVGVDFLLDQMPSRLSRGLRLVAALAAMGLMALVLWKCWHTFGMQMMMGDRSQQLGIPIAFYWLPLLVGAAAAMLAAATVALRLLSGRAVASSQAH